MTEAGVGFILRYHYPFMEIVIYKGGKYMSTSLRC